MVLAKKRARRGLKGRVVHFVPAAAWLFLVVFFSGWASSLLLISPFCDEKNDNKSSLFNLPNLLRLSL